VTSQPHHLTSITLVNIRHENGEYGEIQQSDHEYLEPKSQGHTIPHSDDVEAKIIRK